MSHGNLERIREIFLAARALPADQRAAFIKSACGDDAVMLNEVAQLLTNDVEPTISVGTSEPSRQGTASQIGPYTILGSLGEGGMGTVYKAEQRHPIRRTVAIKVIKLGYDSKEVIARFESERQALARMDHPNIARVLDAGTDYRGRPYFVMEYVPGTPITKYADDNRLTIKQRLELMLQVCQAIGHAHAKAIIHRDIKASNVLAHTTPDGPHVKVIDFGVAKALTSDRLTDRTFNTLSGQAIGTYESMSPEQAAGLPDIDTRSDIYSLGVLLYELLSGTKPFDKSNLAKAADEEIRRIIKEEEPPRPSTQLSSMGEHATKIAKDRQVELEALTKQLKSELDWIPLMALRKERERRYATPLQMGEDIQKYLDRKPLIAAPDSAAYRVKKLALRNKGLLSAAASLIIVLLLGISGTTYEWLGQSKLRRDAVREKNIAEMATTRAIEEEKRKGIALAEADAQRDRAERAVYRVAIGTAQSAIKENNFSAARRYLDSAPISQRRWEWGYLRGEANPGIASLSGHQDVVTCAQFSADGTRILTGSADGTARIWDAATGQVVKILGGHRGSINAAEFTRDLSRVVTSAEGEPVRLWNANTGEGLSSIDASRFELSTDGVYVAVPANTGTKIYAAKSGRLVKTLQDEALPDWRCAAISPDRNRFARALEESHGNVGDAFAEIAAEKRDVAEIIDAGTGKRVCIISGTSLLVQITYSPGGDLVTLAYKNGTVSAIDTRTNQEVWQLGASQQELSGEESNTSSRLTNNPSLKFNMDGSRIVTFGTGHTQVWSLRTAEKPVKLFSSNQVTSYAEFSPDGNSIVACSPDGSARIWDVASGKCFSVLDGHEHVTRLAKFSPDGTRILTIGADNTPRLWCVPDSPQSAGNDNEKPGSIEFNCDGTTYLCTFDDRVCVRETEFHRPLAVITSNRLDKINSDGPRGVAREGHDEAASIFVANFLPDGKHIVIGSSDHSIRIWDLETGAQIAMKGQMDGASYLNFNRDGSRLLTASKAGAPCLWDAKSGALLHSFTIVDVSQDHSFFNRLPSLSHDGNLVVVPQVDGTAQVWDAHRFQQLCTLQVRDDTGSAPWSSIEGFAGSLKMLHDPVVSPDGKLIAAESGNSLLLWDAATGNPVATIHEVTTSLALRFAFSPDGKSILLFSFDGTSNPFSGMDLPFGTGRIFPLPLGKNGKFLGGNARFTSLDSTFSPDSSRIVTAGKNAGIWDASSGEEILELGPDLDSKPFFSKDGTRLLGLTPGGTVRLWDSIPASERYKATGKPLVPRSVISTQSSH